MLKRNATILFFLCLAVALYFIYDYFKIPEGIEIKSGDPKETIAWLALATSVVALLTSIVGLIQKLIEKKAE